MDLLKNIISQIYPFNSLLQYIFHRIMGKYLHHDISMSNFAMGNCVLKNLDLAHDKINENLLNDSPFGLYRGHIGKFHLNIPWTKILQESIEISIEGLDLCLYVKDDDLKTNIAENQPQSKGSKEEDIELYDSKVDVFKRIVNKILLNMTVEIKEIRIRLFNHKKDVDRFFNRRLKKKADYMKDANEDDDSNGCLLLKLSYLSIKKKKNENEDNSLKLSQSKIYIDELENFFINIREISLHMITDYYEESPDYVSNIHKTLSGFYYPTISHPTTIMTCAEGLSIHIQKKKLSDELIKVIISLNNIEITMDPLQIAMIMLLNECITSYIRVHKTSNPTNEEEELKGVDLKRNRSLSTVIEPSINDKEIIHRKLSYKNEENVLKESIYQSFHNTKGNLNNSNGVNIGTNISNIKDFAPVKKEEPDFMKMIIRDYIEKVDPKLDYSIKLFEKPIIITHQVQPSPVTVPILQKNISLNTHKNNKITTNINAVPTTNTTSTELYEPEVQQLIAQTEMEMSRSTIPIKQSPKFEFSIQKLHFNVLKETQNKYLQDPFARYWLHASDPLFPKPSTKTTSKYNLHIPGICFESIVTSIYIQGKLNHEVVAKIYKIKSFCVNCENFNENEEMEMENNNNSEIFNSAISSITKSFLEPRKLERKLKFSKKDENSIKIVEILRIQPGKSHMKEMLIKGQRGYVLEKTSNLHKFSCFSKNMEKSCFFLYFKQKDNTMEVSINPVLFYANFMILANYIEFFDFLKKSYKIPSFTQNSMEIIDNSLNLSINRHKSLQVSKKTIFPIFSFNIMYFSVDFEGICLTLENINFSNNPLLGCFKANFTSFSVFFIEKTIFESIFHVFLSCEGELLEKNAIFYQNNEKSHENHIDRIEFPVLKASDLEGLMKKTCDFGVFLKKIQFFCFKDRMEKIGDFIEKTRIFKESIKIQENEEISIKKKQENSIYFSIIILRAEFYINETYKKPDVLPIFSFKTLPYRVEEPDKILIKNSISLYIHRFQAIFTQKTILYKIDEKKLLPSNDKEINGFESILLIAVDEIYMSDGLAYDIQMDCPLKLVEGVDKKDIRKKIYGLVQQGRAEDIENSFIFKQGVFMTKENEEKIEFFKDFRIMLNKNALCKLVLTEKKDKEKIAKILLKGMVIRPELAVNMITRVMNIMKLYEEINEKIQKTKANIQNSNENIQKSSENPQKSKLSIEKPNIPLKNYTFSLEANSLCLDISPYYTKEDIVKNPSIFSINVLDIDPMKYGMFYSNNRSIMLIDGFYVKKQEIEEKSSFFLSINKLKYCLLNYFDFQAETTYLLLLDYDIELNQYYDSIIEHLGFMPILDVGSMQISVKNNEFEVEIASFSVDFCQDSLKILPKHIGNVVMNIQDIEVFKNNKSKEFIEKINENDVNIQKLKKKDSFIVIGEEEMREEEEKEKEYFQKITQFKDRIINRVFHAVQGEDIRDFIKIKVISLGINLYEGLDFNFEISNKDIMRKCCESINKNNNINKGNYQQNDEKIVILNDYFKGNANNPLDNNNKKRNIIRYLNKSLRNRIQSRNLQRFIIISLENLILSYYKTSKINAEGVYNSNISLNSEKSNKNNDFSQKNDFCINFSIENFEVLDSINTSNIKKLISRITSQDMLMLDTDTRGFFYMSIDAINKENNIEMDVFLKIDSFRVFLNGVNVEFLLSFFTNEMNKEEEDLLKINEYYFQNDVISKKDKNSTENLNKKPNFVNHPNRFSRDDINQAELKLYDEKKQVNFDKKQEITLKLLNVEEFDILFDYDATFSNLNKIFLNSFNLINIGNINGLKLNFKEISLQDECINPLLLVKIIDIWKNDITFHQKPKILMKLPYINNLFNLIEGFANIAYMPYKEHMSGGSMGKGLMEGVSSFVKAVGIEGLNLTEIVGKGIGFGLKTIGMNVKSKSAFIPDLPSLIENARGKIDPEEKKKKIEKYKPKNNCN